MANRSRQLQAFTLVELLVVVGIIAMLIGLLLPALSRAREKAMLVTCLSNVRSQLQALHLYANEYNGALASGSDNALLYPGQAPYLPISSLATFQFWLGLNQEPSGLGVLVSSGTLPVSMLFCPTDADVDIEKEAAKLRDKTGDIAWCSYLYRQLDGQQSPAKTKLTSLGNNASGRPVKALILDMQNILQWTGLPAKRNHEGKLCSVGFADGSAITMENRDQKLTLRGETVKVPQTLDSILEYADSLAP